MDSPGLSDYLQYFSTATGSFLGQCILIAALFLAGYFLVSNRGKWFGFGAILLCGIASLFENAPRDMGYNVGFSPITTEFIRTARVLFIALLLLLTARVAIQPRGWRQLRFSAPVFLLLVLEILFALRLITSGEPGKSFLSAIMACLLVSGIYGLLSLSLQGPDDVTRLKRAIVLAGIAFSAICTFEFLRSPTSVLMNHRFTGISANPQFTAIFLAAESITCVSLILNKDQSRLERFGLIFALSVFVVLALWTGSRTGALMIAVGLMIMLRAHVGRWIFVAFAAGLVFLVMYLVFPDTFGNLYRFTEYQSNRTDTFSDAWTAFLNHPVYGDPQYSIIESSYLSVAAGTGSVGLILLLGVIGSQIRDLLRARRFGQLYPEIFNTVEYTLAMSFALAAGALFEGFLLGFATASIVFVYITLALTRFVTDYGQARAAETELNPYSDEAAPSYTAALA